MRQAEQRLGVGLRPGDPHYRAFIGPPEKYDLIAAMVFNLLTVSGLRQHHSVLDIGCGSLRVARLLIPYLNPGCYFGIEPERWLVEQGIEHEVGADLVGLKTPTFATGLSIEALPAGVSFDFAFAQSIFSHGSLATNETWVRQVASRLSDDGVFFATFIEGDVDYDGPESWVYPQCVTYRVATLKQMAQRAGLNFQTIDWRHPNGQTWVAFYNNPDRYKYVEPAPSWNAYVDSLG